MARPPKKTKRSSRLANATKYDAHHTVLNQTYGALADLRRELADSKSLVAERDEILRLFSTCTDSQRSWLLLEDYFEKLSLSRRDFSAADWWPRMLAATGIARLEELAILFLRANRPLPSELTAYASAQRFAEITQAEQEQQALVEMEDWLFPPAPPHLDAPRASLRVLCDVRPDPAHPGLHALVVRLNLYRPRSGEKIRPWTEIVDLIRRAAHEQELFSPEDWEFMRWVSETYPEPEPGCQARALTGCELLQWLAQWGHQPRLEYGGKPLAFDGQILSLAPHLENGDMEVSFSHRLMLPDGQVHPVHQAKLFGGCPVLALLDGTFYVVNNAPPAAVVEYWSQKRWFPVRRLSPRLQVELHKNKSGSHLDWTAGEEPVLRAVDGSSSLMQEAASHSWDQVVRALEDWLLPAEPPVAEPASSLCVLSEIQPSGEHPSLSEIHVRFGIGQERTGQRDRSLRQIIDLARRPSRNQKLFAPEDWRFIEWLATTFKNAARSDDAFRLSGAGLLQWLGRWGRESRLERAGTQLQFQGEVLALTPHLDHQAGELVFTHRLSLPTGEMKSLREAHFFAGLPALVLLDHTFYLLRNVPPPSLLEYWMENPSLPVQRLSHRLRTHLRKSQAGSNVDWDELCIARQARPRFVFELNQTKDTVELRLTAIAVDNGTEWHWTGQEWQPDRPTKAAGDKPEVLEDPRLDAAVKWLRLLDWFTPELGLWVGDASENFLNTLAMAWPSKPEDADYLGNPSFQRLFLAPRRLRPKLVVKGSGIDWLSVSAEWEQEGLKLTKADLERLRSATTRFVKLPNAGWVELDTPSVEKAQETMADLGVDGLNASPIRIGMEQAAALSDDSFQRFIDNPEIQSLRRKLEHFQGIPEVQLPATVNAEMRPYQKEGFHFLCHLTRMKLGGILADDMGLGKTLQTLAWIAWLNERNRRSRKPTLVICPASVLHNWRRESERFTPHLKVLLLESGAARHRLRKQIPQNDIIVTNYALLRRDLGGVGKGKFQLRCHHPGRGAVHQKPGGPGHASR